MFHTVLFSWLLCKTLFSSSFFIRDPFLNDIIMFFEEHIHASLVLRVTDLTVIIAKIKVPPNFTFYNIFAHHI